MPISHSVRNSVTCGKRPPNVKRYRLRRLYESANVAHGKTTAEIVIGAQRDSGTRRSESREVRRRRRYRRALELFESGVWDESAFARHTEPLFAFAARAETERFRRRVIVAGTEPKRLEPGQSGREPEQQRRELTVGKPEQQHAGEPEQQPGAPPRCSSADSGENPPNRFGTCLRRRRGETACSVPDRSPNIGKRPERDDRKNGKSKRVIFVPPPHGAGTKTEAFCDTSLLAVRKPSPPQGGKRGISILQFGAFSCRQRKRLTGIHNRIPFRRGPHSSKNHSRRNTGCKPADIRHRCRAPVPTRAVQDRHRWQQAQRHGR